jgi:hypothetical protein
MILRPHGLTRQFLTRLVLKPTLSVVLTWGEFRQERPDLAEAGRELLYFFGVGLAFLATVRRDGGPRLHPVCPVIHEDGLHAFVIPSPKLGDLLRDGRFALHSYPLPANEDAFYLTGHARVRPEPPLRNAAAELFWRERPGVERPAEFDQQTFVEFLIDSCLLTRTAGHGDPSPHHTIWRAAS